MVGGMVDFNLPRKWVPAKLKWARLWVLCRFFLVVDVHRCYILTHDSTSTLRIWEMHEYCRPVRG